MPELSLTTLQILAASKIILSVFTAAVFLALFKKNKPWLYLLLLTASITAFYVILSLPLKKMFWGNNGDEVFIFSFLTKVLSGSPGSDFYYQWLPPFYPPLYFWAVGAVGRLFVHNGIAAAKLGVGAAMLVWFFGSYFWQKLYWLKNKTSDSAAGIISSAWFWLLGPLIFFMLADFDAVILKPYETVTALFGVIFIGLAAESFALKNWGYKKYLFFGLSGGILFLTYYFWWFILIPALFALALASEQKLKNLKRIFLFGLIMFALALPYLLPLTRSYLEYGLENWQAVFFAPQDLWTYAPWYGLSLKTLILIGGLAGLIFFHKQKFIRANLVVLIVCYGYQLANVIYFLAGRKPLQSAKPFLFLATASLAISAAYALIYSCQKLSAKYSARQIKLAAMVLILVFLPLLPFAKFIDEPVVLSQIEKDLTAPAAETLADQLKASVTDYRNYAWLTSGAPELNAYLPLSYYLAHNPHFSHPAVIYSKRMAYLKKISGAKTAEEFMDLIEQGRPVKINALLLYYGGKTGSYPLFFWQDNYPNGGKELKINLPANIISDKYWEKKYDNGEWKIFIRRSAVLNTPWPPFPS